MWDLIITIIIGLVAGSLGKLIMPGKDPGGLIVTIILGVVGAWVGNFVGGMIWGIPDGDGGLFTRIISATIGAIILLIIYRFVMSKRKS